MNESTRMGHRKSTCDLAQQPCLLFEVKLRREAVEREAFYELHHDRGRVSLIEDREDRHHGWVVAMTFLGLICGISVLLFTIGPAIYFHFAERWQRLHPSHA